MFRARMMLALLVPLAGCATAPHDAPAPHPEAAAVAPPAPTGWAAIATPADRARIEALPDRWTSALAAVPRSRAAKLAAEGPLVVRDAALDLPALPPGFYRCRLVRIGGRTGFATFPADFCYVAGDSTKLSFTKQTGTNLPGGWLHADSDRRQIFLGTRRSPGEQSAPPYGRDPALDVSGVLERVAPLRWRLVMTGEGKNAPLELYELIPAPPEPKQPH